MLKIIKSKFKNIWLVLRERNISITKLPDNYSELIDLFVFCKLSNRETAVFTHSKNPLQNIMYLKDYVAHLEKLGEKGVDELMERWEKENAKN